MVRRGKKIWSGERRIKNKVKVKLFCLKCLFGWKKSVNKSWEVINLKIK